MLDRFPITSALATSLLTQKIRIVFSDLQAAGFTHFALFCSLNCMTGQQLPEKFLQYTIIENFAQYIVFSCFFPRA